MRNELGQSRAARWGLLVSFVALFALISGLYLPGCSENPATSPDTTLSQDETSFFDEPFDELALARVVELQSTVDVEILYGEATFTTLDGGELVVGRSGNFHEFIIYPGAIDTDVVISMEILKVESRKNDDVAVIYEFKPDGLVFSTPGELKVNVAKLLGKKKTCLRWYYLNEQTGNWVYQGEYCADADGIATIFIDHFSRYGAE